MLGTPQSVERWLTNSAAPSDGARIDAVHQRLFGRPRTATPEHYTLHEELGRGRFGRVYRATDTRFPRTVAVKIITYDPRSTIELERLEREAHSLAQLSHPNIVQIHEKGIIDIGSYFLAMEYVEGHCLDVWCKRELPPLSKIIDVFAQASEGLHHAHQRQLIHRDFKPSNVVVGNDGRVRILDFGLAKAISPDVRAGSTEFAPSRQDLVPFEPCDSSTTHASESPSTIPATGRDATHSRENLTAVGSFVGTPHYASPEQLAGARIDARSDQFSLCVALFEAVYGAKPFGGRTIADVQASIESGPKIPSRTPVRVPRWLASLLRRGLSPRASDRFDDMGKISTILQRHLSGNIRPRLTALTAGAAGAAAAIFTVIQLSAPNPIDLSWNDAWPSSTSPAEIEKLHGKELRRRLEQYEAEWANSLATYDQRFDRDPRGPAIRCLEAGKQSFTDYVSRLGETRGTSLDGRTSTTREYMWLEELFDPADCLAPRPRWEADGELVGLLLAADEARVRGDYEASLEYLDEVRDEVPRDHSMRSGLIDYQIGTMQLYTHRPDAWFTLGSAVNANGGNSQFFVDAMSRRIEAGAFSDSVDIQELQSLLVELDKYDVETDRAIVSVAEGHVNFQRGRRRAAKQNYSDARKMFESRPDAGRTAFIIAYCELHEAFMESWEDEPRIDTGRMLDALERIREIVGRDHRTVLRFAIKVARVLENIEELDAAKRIINRAIKDRGKVLPDARIAHFDTLRARAERMHIEIMLGRKTTSISADDLDRWRQEAEAIEKGGLSSAEPSGRRAEVQRVRELLIEAYGRVSDLDAAVRVIEGMSRDAKTKEDQDDVCYYARPFEAYMSRMSDMSGKMLTRTLEECPGDRG